MKIPYDSLIAIQASFILRLEELEKQIQNAEQNKNKNNLEFWTEKHQSMVKAVADFRKALLN